MKTLSTAAMAISLLVAAPAFAVDEHHPEKAQETKAAPAKPKADTPATVKKMQSNVKKMQAQLDRVAKAKTDDERQKAIAEHMLTMQENMHLARGLQTGMMDCSTMHGGMKGGMKGGMMGGMMGDTAPAGASPDRLQQMEKRMEMMEQMMRRQESAPAPTPAK